MTNGITILGTGGDSSVVGRQLRASGGIVITTARNQLHLDPGPGALQQLAKQGMHPRETTCILLSHQHVNHIGDAAALISAMTHNGIDKRGILITNTLEDVMISKHHLAITERSVVIPPDGRIGINDIEIRAIPAQHYDAKALSYLIQTPHYLLGYTGDTKYSESLARRFSNCNIIIFNCKFPSGIKEGDHLNVDDVIAFLKICKPQLAVLTHFGAKMLDADPLAQARKIHQETKVQIVAAKDGLQIAPSNYDVQQKQQKLDNF